MMAVVAILIGLTTGVISGLIGLGGGVFIVPALVYVFKMSQHEAQGTSLATLLSAQTKDRPNAIELFPVPTPSEPPLFTPDGLDTYAAQQPEGPPPTPRHTGIKA